MVTTIYFFFHSEKQGISKNYINVTLFLAVSITHSFLSKLCLKYIEGSHQVHKFSLWKSSSINETAINLCISSKNYCGLAYLRRKAVEAHI